MSGTDSIENPLTDYQLRCRVLYWRRQALQLYGFDGKQDGSLPSSQANGANIHEQSKKATSGQIAAYREALISLWRSTGIAMAL